MRWAIAFVVVGLFSAPAAWARNARTVHVDCTAPPGGDGTADAPFDTITGALPDASALSTALDVTIQVAAGTCDHETLPIPLGFPVTLRGAGAADTEITWHPPDPVPASVNHVSFLLITGSDVHVEDLGLDGNVPLGPDENVRPPPMPVGIQARGATDYEIDGVRVQRMSYCVRSEASTGRVTENTLGPTGSGIFASGGEAESVVILGNRITYRVNGIAIAGAGTTGAALDVLVVGNELSTDYTGTGPTNPAAMRFSPTGLVATDGSLSGLIAFNRLRGAARYGIIVHGGPKLVRVADGNPYSGEVALALAGNQIDPDVQIPSLVTFTNARATVLPCELDPACSPGTVWDYLKGATYELWHTGELAGALVDDPEFHPVDGYALDNQLFVQGRLVDHQTFVAVP